MLNNLSTYLTVALICCSGLVVSGQSPAALQQEIDHCTSPSCRIHVLLQLSDYHRNRNIDSLHYYTDQLYRSGQAIDHDSLWLKILDAQVNRWLVASVFDSAQYYLFQLLRHPALARYPRIEGQALGMQADLYRQVGNLDEAIRLTHSALRTLEGKNALNLQINLYFVLAEIYIVDKGEYDTARPYVDSAARLTPLLTDTLDMIIQASNIGAAYQAVYQDYTAALPWLELAYAKGKEAGPGYLTKPAMNLSNLYLVGKQDYAASLSYAQEALAAARQLNSAQEINEIKYHLADVYTASGQHASANRYLREVIEYVDTMIREAIDQNLADAQVRFATQEKELQIARQQAQLNRQQMWILIAIIIVLVLVGTFLFWRQQQVQRARQTALALQLQAAETGRLRELDAFKADMLIKLSHELRTPLTLMLGPLQNWSTGKRGFVTDQELPRMARNAQRLRELVDQLLDMGRLEQGALPHRPRLDSISSIVTRSVGFFDTAAQDARVDLTVESPEQELQAEFDADHLQKMLTNLISNALKHTPPGGAIVVTAAATAADHLRLQVSDTGQGIDPAQLPHIFERFYQSDQRQDGMGLGLALVKQLVDLHAGEIKLDSSPGHGTTVVIHLPWLIRTAATRQQPSPTDAASDPIDSATTLLADKRPRILVIEDNADISTYIHEILADTYEVQLADTAEQGHPLAIENTPDLITLDVVLPGADGITLARQLTSDPRTSHIPIIMLTARAGTSHKQIGLAAGAIDYLAKPFNAQELRQKIGNLLHMRQQWQTQFQQQLLRPTAKQYTSVDEVFLKDFQTVIEMHMGDSACGVDRLASALYLSRSQLYRKIQALTGESPSTWLRRFRLEKAHRLLSAHTAEVTQVASEVGFRNMSHFSTAFKKHFGYAPSAVRDQ